MLHCVCFHRDGGKRPPEDTGVLGIEGAWERVRKGKGWGGVN